MGSLPEHEKGPSGLDWGLFERNAKEGSLASSLTQGHPTFLSEMSSDRSRGRRSLGRNDLMRQSLFGPFPRCPSPQKLWGIA